MDEIISIENLDLILQSFQESKIKENPCRLFESNEILSSYVIDKKSASDSDVILSNIIANKKFKFGLSMKMWFDWMSLSQETIKTVLLDLSKNQIFADEKIKEKNNLLKFLGFTNAYEAINFLNKKLAKNKKKFLQTKSVKEKIKRREKELNILISTENFEEYLASLKFLINFIIEKTKNTNVYYGLKYEKCVYEFITNFIIKPKVSPNFIPLLTSASCNLKKISESIPFREDDERLQKIQTLSEVIPELNLEFILTGTDVDRNKFLTLYKSMHNFTPETFMPIFFQIVYSLAVMDHFGIVHNDLHENNIFVQRLSKPITMSFHVDGKILQISTKFIIKFFDWDRAYVEALGPNKFLEFNSSIRTHQFNKKRTKQDFYQILCFLQQYRNIWFYICKHFPEIPQNMQYIFRMKKADDDEKGFNFLNELTINNDILLQKYLLKNSNKYEIDSDAVYWTELDISLIKSLTNGEIILTTYANTYPNMPYTNLDSIFLGLQFINEKNEAVNFRYGKTIRIFFATGWYCQSYFDVKDEVLPPAIYFLKSLNFEKIFNKYFNIEEGEQYTFPSKGFSQKYNCKTT